MISVGKILKFGTKVEIVNALFFSQGTVGMVVNWRPTKLQHPDADRDLLEYSVAVNGYEFWFDETSLKEVECQA